MSRGHRTSFVHEGQYAVAVEVERIESDTAWSPYLSLEEAQKLDEVREALRKGDRKRAGQLLSIAEYSDIPTGLESPINSHQATQGRHYIM